MSDNIVSFEDLQKRVREKQASVAKAAEDSHSLGAGAKGDKVEDIKDPNIRATPKYNDPAESNKNHDVPSDSKNTDSANRATSGSSSDVDDPNEKGTVSNPKDPAESNKNHDLPSNSTNKNMNVKESAQTILNRIAQKRAGGAAQQNENINQGLHEKLASSQEKLASLGQAVLEVEGGLEFARRTLDKKAGADMAKQLISEAKEANTVVKQAEQQQQYWNHFLKNASKEEIQQVQELAAYQELMKNASADDKQMIEKVASVHKQAKAKLQTEQEKQAYDQGAADAAIMMDAEEAGQIPAEGEAMGEPTIEEILMILDQLVQAGEIDEQTAIQLAEMLMAEMEAAQGGAAPAAADPKAASITSKIINKK